MSRRLTRPPCRSQTDSEGLTSTGDAGIFGGNIETAPVPEPMSLSLFGAALAGFGFLRRRKAA